MVRTYSELIMINNFLDRFRYLKLGGTAFEETFGRERYLNQAFYKSKEWLQFRRDIILRDNGCDLAFDGKEIIGRILIHHLNPITAKDILYRSDALFDPENVVSVQKSTHDAIHYGDESLLLFDPVDRSPDDTYPWR